jgi:hypothetical protein
MRVREVHSSRSSSETGDCRFQSVHIISPYLSRAGVQKRYELYGDIELRQRFPGRTHLFSLNSFQAERYAELKFGTARYSARRE